MSLRRAAAFLLFLSVAACGAARDPERDDLERAVRAYNDAVIRAHRERDAALASDIVTARELRKIIAIVDLKRGAELVLEADVDRLEVDAVEPLDDRRLVRTTERWRYRDRPLAPGASPGPLLVADMSMEYQLLKEDGRWKVNQVRTLSNQYYDETGAKRESPAPKPTHGKLKGPLPGTLGGPGATPGGGAAPRREEW
jgi:hypothetical protein